MNTYNTYDFNSDTSFIPMNHCKFDIEELKTIVSDATQTVNDKISDATQTVNDKISDATQTVNDKISDLNQKVKTVDKHLEHATRFIVDKIKESEKEVCLCNIASKEDIKTAVKTINEHVDEKFNEIDFMGQFDNLNNQLKQLQNGE